MNSLSVKAKLGVVPLIFILALGATCAVIVYGVSTQRNDGVLVDTSGRQRMLNQRFVKEILVAGSLPAQYREAALAQSQKTFNLFSNSLSALKYGGDLIVNPGQGITKPIPAADDSELIAVLSENEKLLERLKTEAATYIEASKADDSVDTQPLIDVASQLHVQANNAVKRYVALSNEKIDALIYQCLVISLFAALLGLAISMFLARSISKPLMLCRDALNKVSAGDLTALVNLNRKDEFGDMASALDNTVTSLKMALGEDKVNWDDVASYFRELRSSMKQITAIITQSPLPMMLATQSGVVSYANPAAENSLRQLSAGAPASGTLKDQKISESIFSSLDEHLSRPSSLPLSTQLVIAEEHLEAKLELIETVDDEDDVILMTWKVITQDLENAEALRQSEERDKAAVENLKNLLKDLRNVFELAGKGDLTHTLAQSPDQSLNEIVNTVNEFMEHLSADLSGVLTHAQELSNSAFLVSGQSEEVESGAVDSNKHCKDVATNSSEVAELLTGAAAAIQEISSTISSVSDGTNNAEKVANDAVEYTRRSAETVQSLYDSSTNIGSVLKMISAIAEQTNLLALNATIEAARAGEAGKGFAVVANEVKELAKQTADATDEIGSRVKNIQADSNNAVDAISNIDRIVNEINDYQSTIAVSLEQQSAAVKEMSDVVHRSVNKSESINVRMDEVLNITEDAKTISGDSLLASSALVGESEALNRLLSKYQLKNRQASASS